MGINDTVSLHNLKEKFQDFKLSPNDLPVLVKYKAADGIMRPKAGLFWLEVEKMTTLEGQPRFNLLHKLISGLMTISVSNADSEQGFSMLRKIHTDQRSNLEHSSIVALMAMKFNLDDCCWDIKLSPELLHECKTATKSYVAPHSDTYFSWSFLCCFSYINFLFLFIVYTTMTSVHVFHTFLMHITSLISRCGTKNRGRGQK